jgi:hypothetical protein
LELSERLAAKVISLATETSVVAVASTTVDRRVTDRVSRTGDVSAASESDAVRAISPPAKVEKFHVEV